MMNDHIPFVNVHHGELRKMSGNPSAYHGLTLRKRPVNRMLFVVGVILLFGVFLTFINIFELRRLQSDNQAFRLESAIVEGVGQSSPVHASNKPIVWVQGKRQESGYLKHVFNVFDRIGYMQGTQKSNWNVMWAHDYPFTTYSSMIKNLKSHQRVNHWPGSGFVTNKVSLATSSIKFVPKAFSMPSEKKKFMQYVLSNPDALWVQKSNNHRGIKIKTLSELNLTSTGTFVQRYVDNPFLIDGRRFDIGIYAVVTSVNPLRVYVYEGDWLIRFCASEYHPFDAADASKYVVHDDYKPVWKLGSLKKAYTDLGFTFKESLLAFLHSKGRNVNLLQENMHRAVRETYLAKESELIDALSAYKSSSNFFELVRFDFILDEYLNVYLMEVNMSPNLSSRHFPLNKLLYEQVLYSMMCLVGLANPGDKMFSEMSGDAANMQVSDRDILVHSSDCLSSKCEENCWQSECNLCPACLNYKQRRHLKSAYLEHVNKKSWRRVQPTTFKDQEAARQWNFRGDVFYQNLSAVNRRMSLWFHGKCLQNSDWCR